VKLNKSLEYTEYLVIDNDFNRVNYRDLVGKVFKAPPGYASVLPYRRIKTKGIVGVKPVEESNPNPDQASL